MPATQREERDMIDGIRAGQRTFILLYLVRPVSKKAVSTANSSVSQELIELFTSVFTERTHLDERQGVPVCACPHGQGLWTNAQVFGGLGSRQKLGSINNR